MWKFSYQFMAREKVLATKSRVSILFLFGCFRFKYALKVISSERANAHTKDSGLSGVTNITTGTKRVDRVYKWLYYM